ncbi:MAG: YdbL family protein [Chromatiales bacterium]|nr:YdbL family protein [Chromatiales bacterium]
MKVIKYSGVLATLLFLAACVTINIYFPAAQAEQAAERIVDDILGKETETPKETPQKDKGASLDSDRHISIGEQILNFIVPTAHAAEPDFTVNTPAIRKIQARMKARHGSLAPFYSNGAIGFTKNALVAVRDSKAVGLKNKARVNNLLKEENRDRNALYQAIADANGRPEWEGRVRAVFAKTWIEKATGGWWYQNSKGQWLQK